MDGSGPSEELHEVEEELIKKKDEATSTALASSSLNAVGAFDIESNTTRSNNSSSRLINPILLPL